MRTRCLAVVSLSVCLAVDLAESHAQDNNPPFDPAIEVQLFEYAIGPRSFLTVTDADIAYKDQFSADLLVTFLTDPFTVYNVDERSEQLIGRRTAVVASLLAGELSAGYGLSGRVQLGIALPVVFSISGQGIDPASAMPDPQGLQATGFGDVRAEAKTALWRAGSMRLAALGAVTLPTSVGAGGSDFLGDNLPSLRSRVAFQWSSESGQVSAGSNVGLIVRKPREVYSSTVGQQLVYGAAGALSFAGGRVTGVAEMFGRTGLVSGDVEASPLELNGGVRVRASESISVLAGGGAGLVRGIGSPGLRVFVSVGWAPDYRDSDGDGLVNVRDRCPLVAEDDDSFEDDDGCPELDNDGDLREDYADRCPNQKEDIDGFNDDDGCPDLDNDRDGLADLDDRCPEEAEDGIGVFGNDGCPGSRTDADDDQVTDDVDACVENPEDADGFEDWDGCPEADNDGDGVADADDQCPVCSEDRDGFADHDGCPELDNDGDGISDDRDQCPVEAETINGVDDLDGCPDRGGEILAQLEGDRLVLHRRLRFSRSAVGLRPRSIAVIEQVATIVKAHPEVTSWLIVVAGLPRGNQDKARARSQRQANVIKANLLMRGIESERIRAVGAVSDTAQVAIVAKERAEQPQGGDAECPAGYQVEPRQPEKQPERGAAMQPERGAAMQPERDAAMQPERDAAMQPETRPGDGGMDTSDMMETLEPGTEEPSSAAASMGPDTTMLSPGAGDGSTSARESSDSAPMLSPVGDAATVPAPFARYSGVVSSIRFRRNTARMRSRTRRTLDAVATLLGSHPDVHLAIAAHTDSRKGPQKSLDITRAQAETIAHYLIARGIDKARLEAVGYGMEQPIGNNRRSSGRKKNRRVEFVFSVKR